MEKKVEQLSKEVVDILKSLDSKLNEIIVLIGKIDLDLNQYEKEIKKLNSKKVSLMDDYLELRVQLDNQLKILQTTYPNGSINLSEGTIEYTVSSQKK